MSKAMIFKQKTQPITISNRLLQGTTVTGTIQSEGDFRIDGTIEGNIKIKGKLVIGPEGLVKGTVECASAKIEGNLTGDIMADDIVQLLAQSIVKGNIYTSRIIMEEGAIFNGQCIMKSNVSKKQVTKQEESLSV
ncbi:bactofilin family protein [Schleiferia thermophila]|uniref:bactofilin family protein n=2 Tax=Schleiferia thermophila TaxID=884107 RepID=UPI001268B7D9